ncbi:MAG: hypothetical protein UHK60_11985 [Acutalibacteraceae bacterium]|nr:hypothetical protein [Acutalibacteraceae bacterium]
MFKTNPDLMRMYPTPERVLAVCRLVAQKPISKEDLQNAMSLLHADADSSPITDSVNVALSELDLIKNKNGLLTLAVDESVISSTSEFRRYVSAKVFQKKDSTFYMFTRWVISQNERLFALTNWESMAKTCAAEHSELKTLNENAALGWRFWVAFLGLGYLSGTMFIPNMKPRLEDVIKTDFSKNFKYNEAIRATDFIVWLSGKLPEVDMSGKLPLALSAGLRTLHELHIIELATWQDGEKIMLYFVDGDPINDFTHITVKEV